MPLFDPSKFFPCTWRRGQPPPTLLFTFTMGGTTITVGQLMDITLHVGGREFFQLSGKDSFGDVEALTGGQIAEGVADPQIATVTPNPANPAVIAIDGIAAGQTTVTINYTNADGAQATPVTLNVTVVAADVVEVDVAQVGSEVPAGTAFPA